MIAPVVVHWGLQLSSVFYGISILAKSVHSIPEKCCGVGVQGLYLTLPLICTANAHKLLHLPMCQLHHLLNKDNSHLPNDVLCDLLWYNSLSNGH